MKHKNAANLHLPKLSSSTRTGPTAIWKMNSDFYLIFWYLYIAIFWKRIEIKNWNLVFFISIMSWPTYIHNKCAKFQPNQKWWGKLGMLIWHETTHLSIAQLHSRAYKEYVNNEIYICRKHQIGLPVFTFGAEERLLASVLAHVRAQSAGVGATVLTVGALEGSLARVSPHMTLDTAPVRSLVVTVRTQVRLLACMSAYMLR